MAERGPPGDAIDGEAIDRLDRLGGRKLVGEMVRLFLRLGPERIAAAREGLKRDDLEAVERAAHSLKSSAGNVGARSLAEAAERLERVAESERVEAVPPALEVVERELDGAIAALRPLGTTPEEEVT